jgi:hypothetical protein
MTRPVSRRRPMSRTCEPAGQARCRSHAAAVMALTLWCGAQCIFPRAEHLRAGDAGTGLVRETGGMSDVELSAAEFWALYERVRQLSRRDRPTGGER